MPTEASSILLEVAVGSVDGTHVTSALVDTAVGPAATVVSTALLEAGVGAVDLDVSGVLVEVAVADDPIYITSVLMETAVAIAPLRVSDIMMEVGVFSPPPIQITSVLLEAAVPSFITTPTLVSPYQGGSPVKGRSLAGRGMIPFGWRDRGEKP